MLTLGDAGEGELRRRLSGHGLSIATGPFAYRLTTREPRLAAGLAQLYADYPLAPDPGFHDFHVRVDRVSGLRGRLRPQVSFWHDGQEPFKPLAAGHAFALLEWGMNWCVAAHAHHFLLLHAAVLEHGDRCIVLPGDPGAGKSTLAAALMLSGWRLLSDELAVVDPEDGLLVALARPVSLKNTSIDVVRAFDATAVIGEPAHDTHKGTVAHLRPSADSVHRMHEKAMPAQIVFPRWRDGAATRLTSWPKADAFMQLAGYGFNYSLLGRLGFELCGALIDRCGSWNLEYSRLDEAVRTLRSLLS